MTVLQSVAEFAASDFVKPRQIRLWISHLQLWIYDSLIVCWPLIRAFQSITMSCHYLTVSVVKLYYKFNNNGNSCVDETLTKIWLVTWVPLMCGGPGAIPRRPPRQCSPVHKSTITQPAVRDYDFVHQVTIICFEIWNLITVVSAIHDNE